VKLKGDRYFSDSGYNKGDRVLHKVKNGDRTTIFNMIPDLS
jgi:hypothetical protein